MKQWAPYIFISPFFILFAVFSLFPLLFSIYLSFNQWEAASGVEAMQWVGLDNYKYALSDPWFLRSLGNTLWLALASGVPQHLVAIPLAAFSTTASSARATWSSASTFYRSLPPAWPSPWCSTRCFRATMARSMC